MEFQTGHPITQVNERRTGISCNQLVFLFQRRQENNAGFHRDFTVIFGGNIIEVEVAGFLLVECFFTALQHLRHPCGDFVTGLFHFGYGFAQSDGIPCLKGTQLAGKPPFQGIIHIDDVIGNFRNTVGGIDERFTERLESEFTRLIFGVIEGFDFIADPGSILGRLQRRHFHFFLGGVIQRVVIQGQDHPFTVRILAFFIESLPGLFP